MSAVDKHVVVEQTMETQTFETQVAGYVLQVSLPVGPEALVGSSGAHTGTPNVAERPGLGRTNIDHIIHL
jgi:hypothetical protein